MPTDKASGGVVYTTGHLRLLAEQLERGSSLTDLDVEPAYLQVVIVEALRVARENMLLSLTDEDLLRELEVRLQSRRVGSPVKYTFQILNDPNVYLRWVEDSPPAPPFLRWGGGMYDVTSMTRFVLLDESGIVPDRHTTRELPGPLQAVVCELQESHYEWEGSETALKELLSRYGIMEDPRDFHFYNLKRVGEPWFHETDPEE